MWVCAECGEQENEDSFNYCFSCGAGMPGYEQAPQTAELAGPEIAARPYTEHDETNEFRAATQEREQYETYDSGGDVRSPVPPTTRAAEPRRAADEESFVSVRLSPEAREAIELLIRAERFGSPEEAAGFLIVKGVESQSEFLYLLWQKLKEIDRLRDELRRIGG